MNVPTSRTGRRAAARACPPSTRPTGRAPSASESTNEPAVAEPRPEDLALDDVAPEAPRARSTRRRRRRRSMLVVAIVVALVLVPLAVVGGWFVWQLDPPGDPGAPVSVVIEPGWGAKEAGDALASAHVIGSGLAFQVWTRLSGVSFQAGTYQLREDLGVRAAADALEAGPDAVIADQRTLLLPPGLTLSRIADRVAALPGHTRDSFLAVANSGVVRSKYQPAGSTSLEGLTWPDTYFIGAHQTDQEILQVLVDRVRRPRRCHRSRHCATARASRRTKRWSAHR